MDKRLNGTIKIYEKVQNYLIFMKQNDTVLRHIFNAK